MANREPLDEAGEIARALAHAAYDDGRVRLVERDLSGLTHIVSTRQGLFGVDATRHVLLAHGAFYGLTLRDGAIFAFESCDLVQLPTERGRVVRLDREGDRIAGATVLAAGLDNGCHQIDFVDGRLTVLDTRNQRVLRFGAEERGFEILHPLPRPTGHDWSQGYAHVNSLLQIGERILLLLHNGAGHTGRPSEVVVLDRGWREIARRALPGLGCHNLVALEDGTLLACGSMAGALISLTGLDLPVSTLMTRGLSVDAEGIVVGASKFTARAHRHLVPGTLTFLDRGLRTRATLRLPAAPCDVRRLDAQDLGLSAYADGRVPFPTGF